MSLVERCGGYFHSAYLTGFFMTQPDRVCTGSSVGCESPDFISFSLLTSYLR